VHQDGLVHISELSNRYIKDPSEAVKAGQIVKVKVLSADIKTKRIALSMKALMAGGSTKKSFAGKTSAETVQTNQHPAKSAVVARPVPPLQPSMSEKLAMLSTKWKVS
jgi:uncharacterized protein